MTWAIKVAALSVALLGFASSVQATPFLFKVNMDQNEPTPTGSPGTGIGTVQFDLVAHTMTLDVTFSGLLGPTNRSHMHAPTPTPFSGAASVATTSPSFVGFPLGVTSGTFHSVLDMTLATSYNAPFITGNGGTTGTAELALLDYALQGRVYWNIHTDPFPGGEIRGFLVAVPEPSTLALFGFGLLGLGFMMRKRALSTS